MTERSVVVHRPVAFPQKFLGAPTLPSITAAGVCILVMMGCFLIKSIALWGVLAMFAWPFLHFGIYFLGLHEPHLQTLMETYHLTSRRAAGIGTGGRRFFSAT